MKQRKTERIISKKANDIIHLGKNTAKDLDDTSIHEFRLAIKRLRSFLRLLAMNTPGKGPKLSADLLHLYHISGHIRDARLQMRQLSASHTLLPAYMQHLHQKAALQEKQWRLHYSAKILKQLRSHTKAFVLYHLHADVLKHFLHKHLQDIDTIITSAIQSDDDLHSVRKKMKDMLFLWQLAEDKWKKGNKLFAPIPVNDLSGLASLIGDYNDQRIAVADMTIFASGDMDAKEKQAINALCDEGSRHLLRTKKLIIEQTTKFIASIQ